MMKYLILLILEKLFYFLDQNELNLLITNNNQILGFLFRLSNTKDLMILINFLYITEQIILKVPDILQLFLREGIDKKIDKFHNLDKI